MNDNACKVSHIRYESGSIPEIVQLVDTVAKKLTQFQRQTIKEADLTPAQYSILSLLWESDGRQFNELASVCCCSPSTITGIVDTLEKKGLVTREPNLKDRRSLLVKLTEQGDALKHSTPTLEGIFRNCCGGIEPDELRQLSELLRKLDSTLIS
jgi:DNA-binding MarR family transcriptional regulator